MQISTPLTVAGQQWTLPRSRIALCEGFTIFPRGSATGGPLSLAYSLVASPPSFHQQAKSTISRPMVARFLFDPPLEVKPIRQRESC